MFKDIHQLRTHIEKISEDKEPNTSLETAVRSDHFIAHEIAILAFQQSSEVEPFVSICKAIISNIEGETNGEANGL